MLLNQLTEDLVEAGCDEAGRGCLAGPVYAAAVIWPKNMTLPFLDDSKKLTEKMRYALRIEVESKALAWAVGVCDNHKIDEINILNASILAMQRAVKKLAITPQLLLIDGNRFKPYPDIAHQCFIKGDSRFSSIAAASILAKTYRDDFMLSMHREYPNYGWDKNKGYPTKVHKQAILENGITEIHRKSFRMYDQLKINF